MPKKPDKPAVVAVAEDAMDDDQIKAFCNITGAGAQVAQQLLQACNGNLEMAINMHMEGQ